MKFAKRNGPISYEKIGKFISSLPKDQWINLKDSLTNAGYHDAIEPLIPAFDFFKNIGHLKTRDNNEITPSKDVVVLIPSKRDVPQRSIKEIFDKIPRK
ncbi:MAG: hypothetical protein AAGG75_13035 [Bacteroidota bacterium]